MAGQQIGAERGCYPAMGGHGTCVASVSHQQLLTYPSGNEKTKTRVRTYRLSSMHDGREVGGTSLCSLCRCSNALCFSALGDIPTETPFPSLPAQLKPRHFLWPSRCRFQEISKSGDRKVEIHL